MATLKQIDRSIGRIIPKNHRVRVKHLTPARKWCVLNFWINTEINGNDLLDRLHIHTMSRIAKKYKQCRKAAELRGMEFSLGPVQFANIITNNCEYCGVSVIWHSGYSIDRKNSSKGYVNGNVVACCKECNFIKAKRSYKEMKALSATKDFRTLKKHLTERWQNFFQCHVKARQMIYALFLGYRKTDKWTKILDFLGMGEMENKCLKSISLSDEKVHEYCRNYRYRYSMH